jgi:hypothetical protein
VFLHHWSSAQGSSASCGIVMVHRGRCSHQP